MNYIAELLAAGYSKEVLRFLSVSLDLLKNWIVSGYQIKTLSPVKIRYACSAAQKIDKIYYQMHGVHICRIWDRNSTEDMWRFLLEMIQYIIKEDY